MSENQLYIPLAPEETVVITTDDIGMRRKYVDTTGKVLRFFETDAAQKTDSFLRQSIKKNPFRSEP